MQRPGFTLIELLVVIAILAILASILMPVFTRARSKGRQATCVSNLSQIGKALQMYADDYDGQFPLDAYRGPGAFWYERIDPYVRNRNIGVCPAKGKQSRVPPTGDHPYEWSYALNYIICRRDMWSGLTLNDLARIQYQYDVSKMLMAAEGVVQTAPPNWFVPGWWPYPQYHEFWHNERSNALFVDGHVKSLGPEAQFNYYPGLLQ